MKHHKSIYVLTLLVSIASIVTSVVYARHLDGDYESLHFSNRSVRGSYGFTLEGVAVFQADGSTIPASAVGRFTADGNGEIVEGVRVLNRSGIIIQQEFSGVYSVDSEGMGELTVYANDIMPDGSVVPSSIEKGRFVINQPNDEWQMIGVDIKGPNGEDLGFNIVTTGIARKQSPSHK